MTVQEDQIIRKAEFNPAVQKYWLLSGFWILLISVVGIPLISTLVDTGYVFHGAVSEKLECVLTDRSLIVRRGIFIHQEKTVPLDKITDLGMVQGPIMRYLNIEKVTVETAGQSSQGALVGLHGIVDAEKFRKAVLAQREELRMAGSRPEPALLEQETGDTDQLLTSIRDTLSRIEHAIVSNKSG